MLTQFRRRRSWSPAVRGLGIVALLASFSFAMACDKMPLVAPTGTVITLFPNSTVLAPNGSIEITAVAIEGGAAPSGGGNGEENGSGGSTPGQGTPVHNGTRISFTTTLGHIEPQEAETHNGQAKVRLFADGRSGVATVRAFSGGASSNELEINVGSAAASAVFLTASPQSLGSAGGSSQINARVVDESGTNLSGVLVSFTADNGTLSSSVASTNDNGVATTQLTTSRETIVTATVGAEVTAEVTVRLNPRINVTITPPETQPIAGVASTYTIGVGEDANVQNVRVNWGDGSSQNLGAISGTVPVQHTYRNNGGFTITVTATDASGSSETVSTNVDVLPAQPPAVTVTPSIPNPSVGTLITLTANVSGATSTITNYRWELGSCSVPVSPVNVTSNRLEVRWIANPAVPGCETNAAVAGTKTVTVTVTQSTGPEGFGLTSVNVVN